LGGMLSSSRISFKILNFAFLNIGVYVTK
jgi:hypothetical protein